jgi:hypothetical protein
VDRHGLQKHNASYMISKLFFAPKYYHANVLPCLVGMRDRALVACVQIHETTDFLDLASTTQLDHILVILNAITTEDQPLQISNHQKPRAAYFLSSILKMINETTTILNDLICVAWKRPVQKDAHNLMCALNCNIELNKAVESACGDLVFLVQPYEIIVFDVF